MKITSTLTGSGQYVFCGQCQDEHTEIRNSCGVQLESSWSPCLNTMRMRMIMRGLPRTSDRVGLEHRAALRHNALRVALRNLVAKCYALRTLRIGRDRHQNGEKEYLGAGLRKSCGEYSALL